VKRLYVQVYLTLVASLLLFALLAGALWRHSGDKHVYREAAAMASEVVESVLPQPREPHEVQEAALRRWADRMRARMTLYAADGTRIAAVGEPLPLPEADADRPARGRGWSVKLSDGRWLVAARERERERRGTPVLGFILALLGLALAVAVGAYPVIRRVTRRLERLQDGVEALGAGKLGARVKVEGRDEVAQLAAQFNRSAAEIERLVGAHRTLLANASHELRSPLARIRMALEIPDPGGRMRAELARDIAELDELIDEILLASRLDAVSEPETREEVDLLALAAEEAAKTDAVLDGEPVMVQGEARLLRRMLRNLLENARRHAPGAPAEIRVRRNASGAEVEVADRGPGVPDAERERIFEPFYRPAGAREGGGGYGLGLSLVRQIARRHGGDVACVSREGGGSRFIVRL
jgi:signal transduction histidine kinase